MLGAYYAQGYREGWRAAESERLRETSVLWVCVDCYATHCNGAASDDPDYAPDRTPLGLLAPDAEISAGMARSEHSCDAGEDVECDCERVDFSWSRCPACGSQLGGAREALTLWHAPASS
jgi:hypothetical protein